MNNARIVRRDGEDRGGSLYIFTNDPDKHYWLSFLDYGLAIAHYPDGSQAEIRSLRLLDWLKAALSQAKSETPMDTLSRLNAAAMRPAINPEDHCLYRESEDSGETLDERCKALESALETLVEKVDRYAAASGVVSAKESARYLADEVGSAACRAHNALDPGMHECPQCPHRAVSRAPSTSSTE